MAKTGEEYKYSQDNVIQNTAVKLDISYRYELFWLCVHYREWEYIEELEKKNDRSSERTYEPYKTKLKRLAKLMPLFIATFHTLPKYSTYWNIDSKEEKFYNELFDLMIVDEAGQVSPEIAVASLSLTKSVLAVGDVHQIEPVWNILPSVDYANAQRYKVLEDKTLESKKNFEKLEMLGFTASSGSLMKIIRKSTPFLFKHNPMVAEKGAYLLEHRRCLDQIARFSAEYVYKGSLNLMVGNVHNKKHDLPPLGFVNVPDGSSEKHRGRSRKNVKEAEAIVAWLCKHQQNIENAYHTTLDKTLAIITPFAAQKTIIRETLKSSKEIGTMPFVKNITIGTVHALQGAERPVIVFSAVHDTDDAMLFFDYEGKYNMLNVALTRAKHSFIIFGNKDIFNVAMNSPSGNLAKILFSSQ